MHAPGSSRPRVIVNMAMSADGKIASANRKITRIGSERDLQHLYTLRSTADAILCGARTVEQSQAILGNGGDRHRKARLRRGLTEYPLRVVASGSGRLSPAAAIWSHRFSPIIILCTRSASAARLARLAQLADHLWLTSGGNLDFTEILGRLHREFAVRRLLVEGGGELNEALFRADVVDEIHLTVCPLILGGQRAPTIADGQGIARIELARRFAIATAWRHGTELYAVFQRIDPTAMGLDLPPRRITPGRLPAARS